MAIQSDPSFFDTQNTANDILFDEPQSLKKKRERVYQSIFGTKNSDDPTGLGQYIMNGAGGDGDQATSTNNDPTNDHYKNPQSVRNGREELLNSLEKQKVDPDSYTIDKPEKPGFDKKKFKKAKNLSKMAFIAQGVDALTDAIGAATDDDYAVAPCQAGQTGIQAYNTLANMDHSMKQRLQKYNDKVFDVNKYNQQARRQADAFNKNIDTKAASQQLAFAQQDAKAKAAAQKAIDDAKDAQKKQRTKTYIEEGHRLVSQGDEKAAIAAYKKAGLGQEGIAANVSAHSGGHANTKPDPAIANMVNHFRTLEQKVTKDDYDASGNPISPAARSLENLRTFFNDHPKDLYDPQYGYGKSDIPKNETVDQFMKRHEQEQKDYTIKGEDGSIYNPQWYESPKNKASDQPLNEQKVKEGLKSKSSQDARRRDSNQKLIQQIQTSDDVNQQWQLASQLEQNWRKQGFSKQKINMLRQRLFDGENEQAANNTEPQSTSNTPSTKTQPNVDESKAPNTQKTQDNVSIDSNGMSAAIHSFGEWMADDNYWNQKIEERNQNPNTPNHSKEDIPLYKIGKWLQQTSAGSQIEELAHKAYVRSVHGEDYSDIATKIQQYAAQEGVTIPKNYVDQYIHEQQNISNQVN